MQLVKTEIGYQKVLLGALNASPSKLLDSEDLDKIIALAPNQYYHISREREREREKKRHTFISLFSLNILIRKSILSLHNAVKSSCISITCGI